MQKKKKKKKGNIEKLRDFHWFSNLSGREIINNSKGNCLNFTYVISHKPLAESLLQEFQKTDFCIFLKALWLGFVSW